MHVPLHQIVAQLEDYSLTACMGSVSLCHDVPTPKPIVLTYLSPQLTRLQSGCWSHHLLPLLLLPLLLQLLLLLGLLSLLLCCCYKRNVSCGLGGNNTLFELSC
jgi:hypothetical protein